MMGLGGVGDGGYRFTGVFGSYTHSSGHEWKGFRLALAGLYPNLMRRKYSDDFHTAAGQIRPTKRNHCHRSYSSEGVSIVNQREIVLMWRMRFLGSFCSRVVVTESDCASRAQ